MFFVPLDGCGQLRRCGIAEVTASPAEDVFFDSALHRLPGFETNFARLDRFDATLDLGIPNRFGVGIGWTVEACEEFRDEFGSRVDV